MGRIAPFAAYYEKLDSRRFTFTVAIHKAEFKETGFPLEHY